MVVEERNDSGVSLERIVCASTITLHVPKEYAKRLSQYLKDTGTSPQAIARGTGLGLRTIERVAHGEHQPNLKTRVVLE